MQTVETSASAQRPALDGTRNPLIRDAETNLILPLGTSLRSMLAMLDDLKALMGDENVHIDSGEGVAAEGLFQDEQTGGIFTDGHDTQLDDKFATSVCVTPGSTAEVQAIVKLANKHGVPISPISRGKNLGYGGRSPRLSGSIVVDLGKRMNQVLEINTTDYYCVVQPGVSYFQLYDEIKKRGLESTVMMDCPDLGWGSVLGNTMDRGVGYTPYGDHFSQHCSMTLVLPNGEIFNTGMGAAGADNASRYLFNYGFGPYMDGIFTQSNYAICTEMGVNLAPHPGGYQSYLWTFENESDLPQIVELMRPLRISGVFGHVAQLRHSLVDIACLGTMNDFFPGRDTANYLSDDEFVDFVKTRFKSQGVWNFYGALYGPKAIRDCHWEIIKTEFSKVKGAKYYFVDDLKEKSLLHYRDMTMQGIPNNHELQWLSWRGPGYAHLFFAPISPSRGKDAEAQYELCKQLCRKYEFQYMGNFCIGAREMHHILDLIYDPNNDDEKRRAQALMRELTWESAKLGYCEYRTHNFLMDQVAATYGGNNQIQLRFQEALKDAIDPNGILAPGKSGIWPKRLRNIPGIRLGVPEELQPKAEYWPRQTARM
ncbi:alcohol oxidase [Rhodotorula toruloides]|uniref:Alcohol oxidase n=1 Tax=Rhodotorula toruloides TaxID=5286 RepID=A0A511KFJ9_RHOTO|nr:alcohol oxidase [Rhodotorula toruloides]